MNHNLIMTTLAASMTCGLCGRIIQVSSEYSCCSCGRMLCKRCGNRWGLCKDHTPMCTHPELYPTQWDQPKPLPTHVIGKCKHNYQCPICGFGVGSYPCSCDEGEL